jgi:hypothetical protein
MTARLTVVLEDESLYRKLKVRAAEEGVAMKDLIEGALKAYLGNQRKAGGRKPFDWDAFHQFQRRVEAMDAENPEPSPTDLSDIKHHLYGYPKRPFDPAAWEALVDDVNRANGFE